MTDETLPLSTSRDRTTWLSRAEGSRFRASDDRQIYFVWIAIVWLLIAAGFLSDLTRYFAEVPPPPAILHIHGLITVTGMRAGCTIAST